MREKLYFITICFIITGFGSRLHAQESHNIVPVSPEAAALAKSVNYPVNKNTGIPDISIPFYDIKVGNLDLPIKFVYHGGGFKIHEHATRAGLGWSLSANLQITRTINGLDDFTPGTGYIANSLMKAYNFSSPGNGSYFFQGSSSNWYRIGYDLAAGLKDGEPDKFNYSLLGKSGSFYFMKNAAGTGYTIMPVPFDNIKITYNNGQFMIVDTDGTTYYFGEQGGGDLYDLQAKGKEVTGAINEAAGTCIGCKVTGWKCIRIESSVGTNEIDFTYQAKTVAKYRSYSDRIEYYDNKAPCSLHLDGGYFHSNESPFNNYNSYENIIQNYPFYRLSSPKYMVYYGNDQPVFHWPYFDEQGNMTDVTYEEQSYNPTGNAMDIAGLALAQIEFRGGKVVFNGADQLTSVSVSDNDNHTVKSAHLYQSFTNAVYTQQATFYNGLNFQGTPYLDSLHIDNGGNTYERYAFLYNSKFCYGNHLKGHDAWGYPNASTVEIYYANMFGNILSIPSKNVVQSRYYFNLICADHSSYLEDIPMQIGGDDWAEQPDEEDMKKGTLKRIVYPTGGFVDFDWEANKYLETYNSGYDYIQKLPKLSGGLRIRSISYFDGKDFKPVSQLYYSYGDLEDGTGILINRPRQGLGTGTYHYQAVDYRQQVAYLSAPDGPPTCDNKGCLSVKTVEDKTTYLPASFLNYTYESGAPIYYTKVTIYKKDMGERSGKTVYEYYPPGEFMNYPVTLYEENRIPETPLSILKTDGLMGAEKSETQYKYDPENGYQPVHHKDFEYERFLNSLGIRVASSFFHVLYQVVEGNYNNPNPWVLYDNGTSFASSPGLENDYIEKEYGIMSGKLLLSKVTENTFDGDNELTQTTQYYYDNPAYVQPSRIAYTDSKGHTITKTIKYPYDFSGIYNEMVADNIIDVPVEVTETNTSLGKEISRKKTNYGDIQVGWGFFAPVSVQFSHGGGPLVTDVTFDRYDQYGNILQRTLKDGIPVSYLWGYNSLYPVAKLKGVSYAQIPSAYLSNVQINNPSSDGALRSLLDNLRSSFSGKEQVSTYTYQRLTGITSETTPNRYTTYYEYDPIGRLIDQKDNDQHVIKSYAYNMTGPKANSLNAWYVNDPMMETYDEDCGDGHYAAYNYIVPGGKYTGSSQEMANSQAKIDLRTDYIPPDPSPCSSGLFATASIEIMGLYYSIYQVYPGEVSVDFLQEGHVVASCLVPFNTTGQQPPVQEKLLHLPPGDYQVSFRSSADTRYADAFLSYSFYATDDGVYSTLHTGDFITIEADHHYEFFADYDMLD